jgi:hypothetical protein
VHLFIYFFFARIRTEPYLRISVLRATVSTRVSPLRVFRESIVFRIENVFVVKIVRPLERGKSRYVPISISVTRVRV